KTRVCDAACLARREAGYARPHLDRTARLEIRILDRVWRCTQGGGDGAKASAPRARRTALAHRVADLRPACLRAGDGHHARPSIAAPRRAGVRAAEAR